MPENDQPEPLDLIEHAFDDVGMFGATGRGHAGALAPALRPAAGLPAQFAATASGHRAAPPLRVHPALSPLLPDGLRRGNTISVTGSVGLLLALLGAASADGAWCALVGFPHISAEAAHGYGIELSRLAIVTPAVTSAPAPAASSVTAVGALLDAVDVVATRMPARLAPGEVRRLTARARSHGAVLVAFGDWPGADLRLRAEPGAWSGIGAGTGRLHTRRVQVLAEGRGQAARPRRVEVLLPGAGGCVGEVVHLLHARQRAG